MKGSVKIDREKLKAKLALLKCGRQTPDALQKNEKGIRGKATKTVRKMSDTEPGEQLSILRTRDHGEKTSNGYKQYEKRFLKRKKKLKNRI